MKKYMVALTYSNPEINQFDLEYVKSDSIEKLQKEVRDYIDKHEVLSSEWEGGQVYDVEEKTQVGVIAYNGKFFTIEECKKYGLK